MSEADELILKILRLSNKALSAKKIENALDIEIGEKVSRRTLNYRLEKLVSLGLLKPVLSDLKQAAYMPMDRYKEWTDVKFQERKIHSDELKEEVIKPWIDQLPKVSGALILLPSPMTTINEYTGEVKLDVETHDLFGDLEHHLDPDVFDRWERFKDLVMEYTERRNQILSEIDESLEKETGLKVSDRWNDGVLYERRASIRVLEEVFKHFTIAGAAMDGDLEINSQVSRDGGSLVYSVDGHAYIKVILGEEDEEVFRMRIDNIITSLVEEWKDLKHKRKMSELTELRQEIGASRDLIDIQLVKYLRKPVFGGDCEYLK